MRFQATFLRPDDAAAPLVGEGTVEISPEGLRLGAPRLQTGRASGLAVVVALLLLAATVATSMQVGHAQGLLDHDEGWRVIIGLGTAALVGGFLGTRKLLLRWLPPQLVTTELAYRYVVSAAAESDLVRIASSSPELLGRITFRTDEPAEVLRAMAAQGGIPQIPPT